MQKILIEFTLLSFFPLQHTQAQAKKLGGKWMGTKHTFRYCCWMCGRIRGQGYNDVSVCICIARNVIDLIG